MTNKSGIFYFTIVLCLISLSCLFFSQYNHAADGTHIYTENWRNGYSFSDKEWADPYNQHGYVDGLRYAKIIPDTVSRLEAFNVLEEYYLSNPDKKQKPIIDVLIEKYKK